MQVDGYDWHYHHVKHVIEKQHHTDYDQDQTTLGLWFMDLVRPTLLNIICVLVDEWNHSHLGCWMKLFFLV